MLHNLHQYNPWFDPS